MTSIRALITDNATHGCAMYLSGPLPLSLAKGCVLRCQSVPEQVRRSLRSVEHCQPRSDSAAGRIILLLSTRIRMPSACASVGNASPDPLDPAAARRRSISLSAAKSWCAFHCTVESFLSACQTEDGIILKCAIAPLDLHLADADRTAMRWTTSRLRARRTALGSPPRPSTSSARASVRNRPSAAASPKTSRRANCAS